MPNQKHIVWYRTRTVLIGVLVLGYGLVNVQLGFATVFSKTHPDVVTRLLPGHPIASEMRRSTLLAQGTVSRSRKAEVERLARAAYRLAPTDAAAIRSLAMVAQIDGQPQKADRLYQKAFQLSRRDFLTNLRMIVMAAEKGKPHETLRYYDVAIRTAPAARTLLMPSLANGFRERSLRAPLSALARSNPPWFDAFAIWMIDRRLYPEELATVLIGAKESETATNPDVRARLLQLLIAEGKLAIASSWYNSFILPAHQPAGNSLDFTRGGGYRPFDWSVANSNTESEGFGGELDGKRLRYWSKGGAGLVAQKLIKLAPGHYRLAVQQVSPAPRFSQIIVSLSCWKQSSHIIQLTLVGVYASQDFIVMEPCLAQWVNVSVGYSISQQSGGALNLKITQLENVK